MVSMSVSQTVDHGFASLSCHKKTIIKMVNKQPAYMACNALGLDSGSAA